MKNIKKRLRPMERERRTGTRTETRRTLIIIGVIIILATLFSISSSSIEETPVITDFIETHVYQSVPVCDQDILLGNGSRECTKYKMEEQFLRTDITRDGIIRIDGKEIKFKGFFCSVIENGNEYTMAHCVSLTDGYHKGSFAYCDDRGGMSCKIVKIYNKHSYSVSDSNSNYWTDEKKLRYKSI